MFWFEDENNVDDTLMLQLLQSSACTESIPFQPLILPCQQGAVGAQGTGRGHNKHKMSKGIFHTLWHLAQQ